jgi:hypothetical protein
MQVEFPKKVLPLELSQYSSNMTQTVQVWVNPPKAFRQRLGEIAKMPENPDTKEQFSAAFYGWWAEILSQGPEDSRFTPAEVEDTAVKSRDTDPQFWPWLQERAVGMINEHLNTVKKI